MSVQETVRDHAGVLLALGAVGAVAAGEEVLRRRGSGYFSYDDGDAPPRTKPAYGAGDVVTYAGKKYIVLGWKIHDSRYSYLLKVANKSSRRIGPVPEEDLRRSGSGSGSRAKPTISAYSMKRYRCDHCGAESTIGTNHYGQVYSACRTCAWKRPLGPHSHTCLESCPPDMDVPEPWNHVRLGDVANIVRGSRVAYVPLTATTARTHLAANKGFAGAAFLHEDDEHTSRHVWTLLRDLAEGKDDLAALYHGKDVVLSGSKVAGLYRVMKRGKGSGARGGDFDDMDEREWHD